MVERENKGVVGARHQMLEMCEKHAGGMKIRVLETDVKTGVLDIAIANDDVISAHEQPEFETPLQACVDGGHGYPHGRRRCGSVRRGGKVRGCMGWMQCAPKDVGELPCFIFAYLQLAGIAGAVPQNLAGFSP